MRSDSDDIDRTQSSPASPHATMLGHYRIIELLGEGGMGRVLLAEDTRLQRPVAIKLLAKHLADRADFKQRFLREARTVAKLTHPNVCGVYAIEESGEHTFIVMEYVRGQTLRHLIRAGTIPLDTVCTLLTQCCEGLQAAHDLNIVHRDIKSSNIMVDATGRVKILDFGLAKQLAGPDATQSGGTMGTFQYMSPEQISGQTLDHRSDLFSLGVVFYEMLTRVLPFEGENSVALSYSITSVQPAPVQSHRPDLPPQLQVIIDKVLAKDRSARYQAASDMARDLGNIGLVRITSAPLRPAPQISPVLFGDLSHATTGAISIAVLPFSLQGALDGQEYLPDGFCEEITTRLARMHQFRVLSRSVIARLMRGDFDPVEIAAKLGVSHYVEGTIRRTPDEVRVSVELVKAKDCQIVWSSSLSRPISDVFVLQQEIAQAVCASLGLHVTSTSAGEPRPTAVNPAAYDLYLRGKFHSKKRDRESLEKAVDLFSRAISLDGAFAAPYAALAQTYAMIHNYGYEHDKDLLVKAQALAQKAIALDSRSAEAHAALGVILKTSDFGQAIDEFRRAVMLDPSSADAHHYLAHLYIATGRYAQAIEEDAAALSRDPFLAIARASLCHTYMLSGDEAGANIQLAILEQDGLSPYLVHATRGWLLWCKREWQAALIHLEHAVRSDDSNVFSTIHHADCLRRTGQSHRARERLLASLEHSSQSYVLEAKLAQLDRETKETAAAESGLQRALASLENESRRNLVQHSAIYHFDRAWIHATCGDVQTAVAALVASAGLGFGGYADLITRPDWDRLRDQVDFEALIRRLRHLS